VKSVFITGATGVVGSDLLRAAVDSAPEVKALVRSDEAAQFVEHLGATAVRGDVTDSAGLSDAMWGSDTVFNVAGVNETCTKYVELMEAVNVDGPSNVVNAAADAGVRRVVHTSSVAGMGVAEGMIGSEATVHNGEYQSAYGRSKHRGEQAAMETALDRGIDCVVVNPVSVQGVGRSSGSAELFVRALTARRPILADVTVSIVDRADCTKGHLLAAEQGIAGERYILSGHSVSVSELVNLMSAMLDRPLNPRWISEGFLRSVGMPLSRLAALFGKGDDVCPDLVRTMLHGHRYDNTKSRDDLGMSYTPLEDTLFRLLEWLRSEGHIGT